MFGPNLNGEEPHWIIGALFAIAILAIAAFPVAVLIFK